MSFAEKVASLMARPNQPDPVNAEQAPWYLIYGRRALGITGAFFSILFGLWNVLGIVFLSPASLIAGVLEMLAGFIVMALEAPCCFFCIDYVNEVANKVDQRPMWNRAALYCVIALPPIFIYPGLASIFGCGLILGTGVLYGMMSLGKKASAEEMRQAAVNAGMAGNGATTPKTNDRASIINNAQPFSFTGAVGTDSNV